MLAILLAILMFLLGGCAHIANTFDAITSSDDFSVHVNPGLSLAETKITITGGKSAGTYGAGKPYDYAQLAAGWVKQHHPEWGKHWGVFSKLGGMTLKVVDARTTYSIKPLALSHHVFNNSDSDINATDSAELHSSITNTSSIEFSQSTTVGLSVSVEVGGDFAKTSATASLETTVGKSETKEVSKEIGSSDSVQVDLPPHAVELAVLFLEQGTITLHCVLEYQLSGELVIGDFSSRTGEKHTVSASELQEYSLYPRENFVVSLQFASQSEIKTKTLKDGKEETVKAGIKTILEEASNEQGA